MAARPIKVRVVTISAGNRCLVRTQNESQHRELMATVHGGSSPGINGPDVGICVLLGMLRGLRS